MTKPITSREAGKGHGGRPRSADRERLGENILTAAAELFLQHGFDATSMDRIAVKARISKRTLYSRYQDKSMLFAAAIYDLLGRLLAPIERIPDEQPMELESVLLILARDMMASTLEPQLLAVHRLITFETGRRPEFGRWINDTRKKPAIHVVATILQRYRDELRITDLATAAEQFWNLTFDSGLRVASLGVALSPRDIDERIGAAVDLFLCGARRSDREGTFGMSNHNGNVAARQERSLTLNLVAKSMST